VTVDDWTLDALCNGLDPQLFELQDLDCITFEQQEELIAEGLKICSGCPVRAACKNNSSEQDRYWTIRGGQPPEGLFPEAQVPKIKLARVINGHAPGEGPERKRVKFCKRGHDDWTAIDKRGKRRCKTCRREDNASDWQKRKLRKRQTAVD
jgi:hypothetical protein